MLTSILLPALIRLTKYWLRCLPVCVNRSWEENRLASCHCDPVPRAERKQTVITRTSTSTHPSPKHRLPNNNHKNTLLHNTINQCITITRTSTTQQHIKHMLNISLKYQFIQNTIKQYTIVKPTGYCSTYTLPCTEHNSQGCYQYSM